MKPDDGPWICANIFICGAFLALGMNPGWFVVFAGMHLAHSLFQTWRNR